jgi:hypothetical protein
MVQTLCFASGSLKSGGLETLMMENNTTFKHHPSPETGFEGAGA